MVEGSWVVIKSSPLSKCHLLKGLLEKQYPQFHFHYYRFNKTYFGSNQKIDQSIRQQCLGVIAELKQLKLSTLSYFDRLLKQFSKKPLILILSPQSFKILSEKRKTRLFQHMMIISELKSLDYLTQLPRLMDEVCLRQRLRQENEKLRKMIALESSIDDSLDRLIRSPENIPTQKGLKITLLRWNQVREKIGKPAQSEVLEAVSRMISRAVRSSDRVLHSKDNEFLVFLSNIDRQQQSRCMQRVREKLSSIQISANTKDINVPFSIRSIDQLPFMS